MSWYRDGTISLTNGSKTVTGTGTTWLGNVTVSSGLKTPIGPEEIESVTSNTALQLVVPYTGSTISNVPYSIIPTQGLVPTLAKRIAEMISGTGEVKDAFIAGDLAKTVDMEKRATLVQLAAATGVELVGYDGGTLQTIADGAKTLQDYAALRAYTGRAKGVRLTTPGIAGTFERDAGDTTSADNGGTIIVDASGRRWKRQFDGTAYFSWFEMVGDWNGSTGTNNAAKLSAMIADPRVTKIVGRPGSFWFGPIGNNEVKFPVFRPIQFDFGGADIKVTGTNLESNVGSAFLSFIDVPAAAGNYTFEDVRFNIDTSLDRGVIPALIRASTKTTSGHSVGPCRVLKGQSIFTCVSDSPLAFRSRSIGLVGGCSGDSVYYGVNLANNGDSMSGSYRLGKVHRGFFGYGINGVDVSFVADSAAASSANLLISASGTGFPATSNVRVRAEFNGLNGPLVIADQPGADGTGVYDNVTIDLIVKSLGSNLDSTKSLVNIGAYAPNGSYLTTEKTVSMDGISINLVLDPSLAPFDDPIHVWTPSPNYGRLTLNEKCQAVLPSLFPKNAAGVYRGPVLEKSGKFIRAVSGDLTNANAVVFIPTKYLASQAKNANVFARVKMVARSGVGAGFSYTIADFDVIGDLSGSGVLRLGSVTQVGTPRVINTPCVISFSLAPGGTGLNITANTYTQAFSMLTAYVEP